MSVVLLIKNWTQTQTAQSGASMTQTPLRDQQGRSYCLIVTFFFFFYKPLALSSVWGQTKVGCTCQPIEIVFKHLLILTSWSHMFAVLFHPIAWTLIRTLTHKHIHKFKTTIYDYQNVSLEVQGTSLFHMHQKWYTVGHHKECNRRSLHRDYIRKAHGFSAHAKKRLINQT